MTSATPTSDVLIESVSRPSSVPSALRAEAGPQDKEKSLLEKSAELLDQAAKKNKKFAKQLHEATYIYAVYGALDGLSLSYSMIKYLFDQLNSNLSSASVSDVMHDWMMTPEGIAVTAIESITIIAFSFLANIYDNKKDKKQFERYIAALWPYIRDTGKAFKNPWKGFRSLASTAEMLGGPDLHSMIVPIGLFLSLMTVTTRICMRKFVVEPRKAMMKDNSDLLAAIKQIKFFDSIEDSKYNSAVVGNFDESTSALFRNGYQYCLKTDAFTDALIEKNKLYFRLVDGGLEYSVLDPTGKPVTAHINKETLLTMGLGCKLKSPFSLEQLKPFLADILRETSKREHTYFTIGIQSQTRSLQNAALLGASLNGVMDGLYLFMGAMGFMALGPLFIPMAVLSIIFTVTCIATRLYEEYDYQRKLVETQAKIELALCGKEIESVFGKMQLLSVKYANGSDPTLTQEAYDRQQNEYKDTLERKLKAFEAYKLQLRSQVFLSHSSAALAGLKNGLAANSAIGGLMFAVATIMAISSVTVPPFFVLACGIVGMTFLIGFLIHSLWANYKHLKANPPANDPSLEKVNAKLVAIKSSIFTVNQLKPADIAILDGNFDPSPQFWFQEWFEVLRSFFSGMAKGQKSVDYTLNPLLETNDRGHYQDSSLMIWFTVFTAGVYAIVLALRANARGFGRPGIISTDQDTTTPPPPPQPAAEPPIPVRPEGGPPREEAQPEPEVVTPIAMPTPAGVGGLQPPLPPIPAGNGIPSLLPHSSLGTTQALTAFSRPTSSEGRAHLASGLPVDISPALTASSEEEDDTVPPLPLDEKAGAVEASPRARASSGEMTALAPVGRFSLFHHPDRSSSAIPRTASASILPQIVTAATRTVSMGCLPLASPGDITPGLGSI